MNDLQRTYLTQLRRLASIHDKENDVDAITRRVINISRIKGLSDTIINRVSEELAAQKLI